MHSAIAKVGGERASIISSGSTQSVISCFFYFDPWELEEWSERFRPDVANLVAGGANSASIMTKRRTGSGSHCLSFRHITISSIFTGGCRINKVEYSNVTGYMQRIAQLGTLTPLRLNGPNLFSIDGGSTGSLATCGSTLTQSRNGTTGLRFHSITLLSDEKGWGAE